MDDSESVISLVPYNKLVLNKRYMVKRNGIIYTGTYYYMFGDGSILGLGQPIFIDFKPSIENKTMLICSLFDEFYELKVKME